MSNQFSEATQAKIDDFIENAGFMEGVPYDVTEYIINRLPAGQVTIRNLSWAYPDMQVKKGVVDVDIADGGEDVLYYLNDKQLRRQWFPTDEDREQRWSVTIDKTAGDVGRQHNEEVKTTISGAGDLPEGPLDITPEDPLWLTFGQAIDGLFNTHPEKARIRDDKWVNDDVWVKRIEKELNGKTIVGLFAEYGNGVISPYTPDYNDMNSTSFKIELL